MATPVTLRAITAGVAAKSRNRRARPASPLGRIAQWRRFCRRWSGPGGRLNYRRYSTGYVDAEDEARRASAGCGGAAFAPGLKAPNADAGLRPGERGRSLGAAGTARPGRRVAPGIPGVGRPWMITVGPWPAGRALPKVGPERAKVRQRRTRPGPCGRGGDACHLIADQNTIRPGCERKGDCGCDRQISAPVRRWPTERPKARSRA
jgi:hypothetical protein